ncbi:MAG: aminomethyl-transferring glycine dehydrogenase subunit GcvPB [Elusimicrobia bacterium]|nr:aminomethyl-transferring glycine dehydrogenase subunit GcvPB [Elusimicrobiota bacterium]
MNRELLYEKSIEGRSGYALPVSGIQEEFPGPEYLRSGPCGLPELSELDIVRHFTGLSRLNYSVDGNFYPLGSCTMKYNPKILEDVSSLDGFSRLHPMLPLLPGAAEYVQGALEVLYRLQEALCDITGMDAATLQPLAGAQGELAGILMTAAYHRMKGNAKKTVIVPDASHGTNPASAAMVGYDVITVATDSRGQMDTAEFAERINDEVAAVVMTCPNTLGIFNADIRKISRMAHSVDALMYYDGANMNAILGKVKPGDIGFDIVHLNLHKTFATPHGGGGPGAGPVCVKDFLAKFLPSPRIVRDRGGSYMPGEGDASSIGKMAPFYGNFGVLLKAYAYILLLGEEGLNDVSDKAVLNANYILGLLRDHYEVPYDRKCMHECVLSAARQSEKGVHALDIAKYLIDMGFHPPTVYFPLIVKEAIMIEPTETESRETIDRFARVMIDAAGLAEKEPGVLRNAPVTTRISRPDEVRAARDLNVRYTG